MSSRDNQEDLSNLIREFHASESELFKSKTIYDHFQKIILENLENNLRDAEEDVSSTSNGRSRQSEEKLSCVSKSVEKRIHQMENYKNALKQSKISGDKLAFLNALNQ